MLAVLHGGGAYALEIPDGLRPAHFAGILAAYQPGPNTRQVSKGIVADPSGATVAQAKMTIENLSNHITATTNSDSEGGYRFLSLAPGAYKISVDAPGFSKTEANFTLATDQNLNFPVGIKVGSATETVEVTAENPLVNTAETRNQMTLETQELGAVPLAGRNMLSLTTLAPGVSGLGLAGGPGVTSGTPGSSVNNFSTETAVDVSANGQGTVANMWIIDGLDVTSSVRQGVLNLVPNPDLIQETTNQVNTYSGRIRAWEWPTGGHDHKVRCG